MTLEQLEHDPGERVRAALSAVMPRLEEDTLTSRRGPGDAKHLSSVEDPANRFDNALLNRSGRPRMRWLLAAAAAVLVVGVAGLVAATSRTTEPESAPSASAIDPSGPLLVLPEQRDDLQFSDGWVTEAQPDETAGPPHHMTVVGVPDGNGFHTLRVVVSTSGSPVERGDWDTIQTSAGTVYARTELWTDVVQQRGDRWLRISATDDVGSLIDFLASVETTSDGTHDIDLQERFERMVGVVETGGSGYSAGYLITDATDTTITVETASLSTPLVTAVRADRVEPTRLNGTDAWFLQTPERDAWPASIGVAWQATPNRVVIVSSNDATLGELTKMAERLQTVDQDTWETELPGVRPEQP